MINLKGPSMGISGRFKIDVLSSKEDKAKLQDLPPNSELTTKLSGKVDKVTSSVLFRISEFQEKK